jgi:hypothetical protein
MIERFEAASFNQMPQVLNTGEPKSPAHCRRLAELWSKSKGLNAAFVVRGHRLALHA